MTNSSRLRSTQSVGSRARCTDPGARLLVTRREREREKGGGISFASRTPQIYPDYPVLYCPLISDHSTHGFSTERRLWGSRTRRVQRPNSLDYTLVPSSSHPTGEIAKVSIDGVSKPGKMEEDAIKGGVNARRKAIRTRWNRILKALSA